MPASVDDQLEVERQRCDRARQAMGIIDEQIAEVIRGINDWIQNPYLG